MNKNQKILVTLTLAAVFYILLSLGRYWYADSLYAKAKSFNRNGDPQSGEEHIKKAITITPREPVYHLELAESYTKLNKPEDAVNESNKAIELSPNNVNYKRVTFSILIRLAQSDPKYLLSAIDILKSAINEAPTDAKLIYNLGLTYARIGEFEVAMEEIEKATLLKPNYKEARLALAYLWIDKKDNDKAKEQLEYILNFIDSNDDLVKTTLKDLK